MKDLPPAEHARRAAVLGIVLSAPTEPAAPPTPGSGHSSHQVDPRSPGKLSATSTMRAALSTRPTPVPASAPPLPQPSTKLEQAEQPPRSIKAKHERYGALTICSSSAIRRSLPLPARWR